MPQAIQPNWIDKAITAVFPKWGYQRMGYRQAINIINGYRGAEQSTLRSDWMPGGGSADADLLPDLPDLRERGRELDRNNPWARSAYNTIAVNTIGTGLAPQSRVDPEEVGADEETVREWQKATQRVWREQLPYMDAQARLHGWIKQIVLFRSMLQNGDVFDLPLRVPVSPIRPLGYATEMIEADRVSTPRTAEIEPERLKRIREGVEFNAMGMPVGYWVRKIHPGDTQIAHLTSLAQLRDFNFYKATNSFGYPNMYHIFWPTRPGQTRGEPWLAPALSIFKDMGELVEAKIVGERIGACIAGFIAKNDPFSAAQNNTTQQGDKRIQTMSPGQLIYGKPGETWQDINPNYNGTDLDAFLTAFLKAVGAAINMPYELLTKDFTRTTYLSARAALLEAWRFFRCYQLFFSSVYLQPQWETVMLEAWSVGKLPNVDLLGPNRKAWLRAFWVPPARGYIDAVKETKAALDLLNGKMTSHQDEAAAQGKDWKQIVEQNLEYEMYTAERRKALGLDENPEPATTTVDDIPQDELDAAIEEGLEDDSEKTLV